MYVFVMVCCGYILEVLTQVLLMSINMTCFHGDTCIISSSSTKYNTV